MSPVIDRRIVAAYVVFLLYVAVCGGCAVGGEFAAIKQEAKEARIEAAAFKTVAETAQAGLVNLQQRVEKQEVSAVKIETRAKKLNAAFAQANTEIEELQAKAQVGFINIGDGAQIGGYFWGLVASLGGWILYRREQRAKIGLKHTVEAIEAEAQNGSAELVQRMKEHIRKSEAKRFGPVDRVLRTCGPHKKRDGG